MNNRAKCKLCLCIIESLHSTDHVVCKCGEIELNGGEAMFSRAKSYDNFLRVDDLGNELVVQYKEHPSKVGGEDTHDDEEECITIADRIEELHRMIESDLNLPEDAHIQRLTYADLMRYMMLIYDILKRNGK